MRLCCMEILLIMQVNDLRGIVTSIPEKTKQQKSQYESLVCMLHIALRTHSLQMLLEM